MNSSSSCSKVESWRATAAASFADGLFEPGHSRPGGTLTPGRMHATHCQGLCEAPWQAGELRLARTFGEQGSTFPRGAPARFSGCAHGGSTVPGQLCAPAARALRLAQLSGRHVHTVHRCPPAWGTVSWPRWLAATTVRTAGIWIALERRAPSVEPAPTTDDQ